MEVLAPPVIGKGSADSVLTEHELAEIVEQALEPIKWGDQVLAIISDKTRDDNTHLLFPIAARILEQKRVTCFDALIAQGTHPPMTLEQKRSKVGALSFSGQLIDHCWNQPDELVTLGELSTEQVTTLTGGLVSESVPVRLNKLLAPGVYDFVLVIGATVPHEVAGFAGGAKYFFPGVAGPELTHLTHWLGALAGIEKVIGTVETPTRHLIEAAADLIQARIISLNTVVTRMDDDQLVTHALFAGEIREAFRRAAEVSSKVHIRYTERKYKRVVAVLDEHYDELWVGGKASYKLGGIVEDGGELIIFAPHLTAISRTHGDLIEKYGYAPLETVQDMLGVSPELRENLCIAAHLAHVSYAGRIDEQGRVIPRYRITLASGIDAETCRRVNLGFIDYRTFAYEQFADDPDTLIVKNAGRDLYVALPRP
jgi:nickel-dependent lactate racemase